MDKYALHKKECDDFIDIVDTYAKNYGFAYVISVGKYFKADDKTVVMDNFYEQPQCALHALTKMPVHPGPIAISIAGSIVESGHDIGEAMKRRLKN